MGGWVAHAVVADAFDLRLQLGVEALLQPLLHLLDVIHELAPATHTHTIFVFAAWSAGRAGRLGAATAVGHNAGCNAHSAKGACERHAHVCAVCVCGMRVHM